MRKKLLTAALLFAAMIGAPTVASADDDRDGWRDRDRREWREDRWRDRRDWRRDRDWRRHYWSDRREWRRDRWRDRRWRRYAYRDVVCRTYWDRWGYPERVCFRR